MGQDDTTPPNHQADADALIAPERWAQLDGYFANRLPLAERVEMDRWATELPERSRLVAELRDLWTRAEAVAPQVGNIDIRHVLNTLALKRDAIDAAPIRRRRLGYGLAAAAVLLLAIGLPVALQRTAPADSVVAATPAREITTGRAQRAALDLADGSRVVLAAGSVLRIPADFNQPTPNGVRRELFLEGKAYFEVTHDSTRPFIVRTATAVTEDLGTEFVVLAYPESRSTQVAVVSGLVQMASATPASAERTMRLEPGDVARADSSGTHSLVRNVALAPYVSWTRGVLAFDGVPLRDALAELSRWYDVDFTLQDASLDSLRITGEFREEPASRAVRRLSLMLGVQATQSGKTVHLAPARTTRAVQ